MVFLAAVGTACSGKPSACFFGVYLCGVMFRIVGDGALDVPFGAVWFQFVTKYKKQTMF
jgi:hypothetical protein